MHSLVVYATRTGNTRTVAETVAHALGERGTAHIRSVEELLNGELEHADLLVVGGPTEGHGMTPAMKAFLAHARTAGLDGVAAAVFDTRVAWPKALSGSAASGIANALREAGARLIVPEASFLVTNKPELRPGELERATAWASALAATAATTLAEPAIAGTR